MTKLLEYAIIVRWDTGDRIATDFVLLCAGTSVTDFSFTVIFPKCAVPFVTNMMGVADMVVIMASGEIVATNLAKRLFQIVPIVTKMVHVVLSVNLDFGTLFVIAAAFRTVLVVTCKVVSVDDVCLNIGGRDVKIDAMCNIVNTVISPDLVNTVTAVFGAKPVTKHA